jgi:hypothetical protein
LGEQCGSIGESKDILMYGRDRKRRHSGGNPGGGGPPPPPPSYPIPLLNDPIDNEDGTVTFVCSSPPSAVGYEWYKNGVAVETTVEPSYTTEVVGEESPIEIIALLNFESGFGVFSPQSNTAEHTITIVPDPTPGSVFGGNVAELYFNTTGFGADVNCAISLPPHYLGLSNINGRTFSERFYLEGELYFPSYPYWEPVNPLSDLRKIFYIKFGDWDFGSQRFNVIVNSYGRADKTGLDLGLATGIQSLGNYDQQYGLGFLAFDTKHKIGLEILTNSEGGADAEVRLWHNDTLKHTRTGFTAVLRPTSDPSRSYWYGLEIGSQEQWGQDATMRDRRYWDNIKFYPEKP